jgi:hypothetical protein
MRPPGINLPVLCILAAAMAAGCAARNPDFARRDDEPGDAAGAAPDGPPAVDASASDLAAACNAPVIGQGTGLAAEYFDNADLTGTRVTRIDPVIDFGWDGAPDPGVGADTFSVRWTGKLQPMYSGPHTFHVEHNDGVRLLLDGRVVLYRWGAHDFTKSSATVTLDAGHRYDLRLEMYDKTGKAGVRMAWEHACRPVEIVPASQLTPAPPAPEICPPPAMAGTGSGLLGEYFSDLELRTSVARRMDARVDFLWGSAVPIPTVTGNAFSVRWTGQLQAPMTGPLTLYFATDDWGRAWLDGVLVMDSTGFTYAPNEEGVTVDTVAGRLHDLRLEMVERGGDALAQLAWSWPCHARDVVPTSRLYPPSAP